LIDRTNLFRVGGLVLDGETFVTNLHISIEEQRERGRMIQEQRQRKRVIARKREREREETSKTRDSDKYVSQQN
jgi:hypothetical protein